MNQNAKRNLQRRKRQAIRLSKREYFRKKKEALNVPAAGKDKFVYTGPRSMPSQVAAAF